MTEKQVEGKDRPMLKAGEAESGYEAITCVGGANIDRKLVLMAPPLPGTSNPVSERVSYGGVARNVAENLGRLGLRVSLLTLVGDDDEGHRLLAAAAPFMDVTGSDRLAGERTGVYTAVLDPAGELFIGLSAMELARRMNAAWIQRKRAALLCGQTVLADLNLTSDALGALQGLAEQEGLRLILVGVSAPKMDRLPSDLQAVDLGFFNVDESQAFLGTTSADPAELARLWRLRGLRRVVVTHGKQPFALAEGDWVRSLSVRPAQVLVDVTGAGDAFVSGVVFGLMQGKTLAQAARLGAANARLNVASADSVRTDLSAALLLQECEGDHHEYTSLS